MHTKYTIYAYFNRKKRWIFFDLVEISTLDNTSTYKNKIISNGFMDQGLFSSDTVSNYTKTIFQEILYENTNSLTNFTITKTNENGQNIFVLKFLTTGLFTLTTTSIYSAFLGKLSLMNINLELRLLGTPASLVL